MHIDRRTVGTDEGASLVHHLEQPVRDRDILEDDPQVVLETVGAGLTLPTRWSRAKECQVELSLQPLLDDTLFLPIELLLRHVEEVREDVAVVDKEALLDRSARSVQVSGKDSSI